jgi:hypothetical protein
MLGSDFVLFNGFCVPFSNPRFTTTVGAGAVGVAELAAAEEEPSCPSSSSSSSPGSSYAQAVTVDPERVRVTSGSYIVVKRVPEMVASEPYVLETFEYIREIQS